MGRGRGRGGRRGGAATTTPTQEQKVVEKSPLTKLIEGLLEQAYTNLSEAERPKADKKGKAVEEFEKTTRQLVAVDHTEYQRLVISLSTMLSLNGIVSGINAKKVIGIVFTYLISEVTRYWHQYGFTKEEHKYAEAEGLIDCTQEEYNSWHATFTFLTATANK